MKGRLLPTTLATVLGPVSRPALYRLRIEYNIFLELLESPTQGIRVRSASHRLYGPSLHAKGFAGQLAGKNDLQSVRVNCEQIAIERNVVRGT
jgi:hypothetical protein